MSLRRRGFTLMEITIGLFLFSLILLVVYQLFVYFRREMERPQASMSMEQSTLQAMRWLQRDLADTNLQSIRSVPNASNPGAYPGLVMESPRDDADHLIMTTFGTVQWKKFIYYQLRPAPGKPGVGLLTYDEDASGVGVEPGAPPTVSIGASGHHRVLAGNVVLGGPGDHTGLHVFWNDSSGTAHDFDDAPTARGEPVNVSLTLTDLSAATGKATTRKLLLQVKPQN